MSLFKKYLIHFVLLMLFVIFINIIAKAQSDKIEGLWYNDIRSAKIQITKDSYSKFNGKIVWLKEPLKDGKPKVDELNTDQKLHARPMIGLPVLTNFIKDGDNKYTGGFIYDPKNGKTYSCNINYKGNKLDIRGYIGISLFGRTTIWERAEN
jgi:uncharacterized protein (DUF2147 family)